MLETVRAYALDRLLEAGELARVTDSYIRWAVGTGAEIEARLDAGEPWRPDFDAAADDLRAALGLADADIAAGLARTLGHLTYARRFLAEAGGHYLRAAECTADDAQAARDLWSAAAVAQVQHNGQLRYELVVAASERASAAGDRSMQSAVLAEAVSVATRFPAIFERDIGDAELEAMLHRAHEVAPPDDPVAAARLAGADAWTVTRRVDVPDVSIFEAALAAAEQVDDPLLISAALDALGAAQVMNGHVRKSHELGPRRLSLLARLAADQPLAGSEIYDILHMSTENAVSAGPSLMVGSKPVVPLVLMGRFDEAIAHAERTRHAWQAAGRPAARWLAPSMYAVVLCHALRGDDDKADDWRAFAGVDLAGEQTRNVHFQVGGMITFVETRLALHFGREPAIDPALAAPPTDPDAWWQVRHWYFDAYPWAAAAEFAAATGQRDARARLVAAAPVADENPWAAGILSRARARLTQDPAELTASLATFEQLGARYERAATLALMTSRRDEARAEFDDLGVPMPA
jgi:hypothetical protein